MKTEWLTEKIIALNIDQALAQDLATALLLLFVIIIATVATILVRKTLLRFVVQWIKASKYKWDDPLVQHSFFNRISWFVPLAILSMASDSLLAQSTSIHLLAHRLVMSGFVIVSVLSLSALLSSFTEIDHLFRKTRRAILQGYIDALKIVTYALGTIFIISIFTGKSPWGILSILGGLTAVTMLVFKDSILGFVASLQLSSADMIRIGDWIEMEQYGADGDVISISIHTVRVQNWDKTITTIPTHALVATSFKNWRGMTESQGRRIKRSLSIDLSTITFCSEELLGKLGKIDILSDYLSRKHDEIEQFNSAQGTTESHLNGRRQTNIGIFRAYIIAYLKNNKHIHQGMTFLVRQLAPTDRGLPIEIYVFSKDKNWVNYEAIQADIFDHLLAAAPEFDLKIFQAPAGSDVRALNLAMR